MEIVYEGKAAGKRPPRALKVSGGELSRAYTFSPTGEPVDVPEPDASLVLALRPAHGRLRALGGEQTPGGVQVLANADELAGEADSAPDGGESDGEGEAVDQAPEAEADDDDAPAAQPPLGGNPTGDPVTRTGRRRGRPRREWTQG